VLRKDFLAEGLNLTLPDDLHACSLETEVEAAYPGKEGSYFESHTRVISVRGSAKTLYIFTVLTQFCQ